MATVWFVNGRESDEALPIARKPLAWCVENIGLRPDNWRADLIRENLTTVRNNTTVEQFQPFGYLMVQIDREDLTTSETNDEWNEGFHLLDNDEIGAGEI